MNVKYWCKIKLCLFCIFLRRQDLCLILWFSKVSYLLSVLFSCCTSAQHPLSRKHPIQIQSKLFNFRNNRFRQSFAFWELFLENHLKREAFFLLMGTAIGSIFIGVFFFLVFLPEGKGQTKLGETEIYFWVSWYHNL